MRASNKDLYGLPLVRWARRYLRVTPDAALCPALGGDGRPVDWDDQPAIGVPQGHTVASHTRGKVKDWADQVEAWCRDLHDPATFEGAVVEMNMPHAGNWLRAYRAAARAHAAALTAAHEAEATGESPDAQMRLAA